MDACQRGVELAPDSGSARDSRGVARALTGDTAGAIADFQAYVEWAPNNNRPEEAIKKRREWIQALKAGRNPFDKATLKALRRE